MHPLIFKIPFFGIIFTTAIILSFVVASIFVKKSEVSLLKFFLFTTATVIFSLLSARLFFYLSAFNGHFSLSDVLSFEKGGIVLWGSVIGGISLGFLLSKILKLNFWHLGDVGVIGVSFGVGIGRIGCFMAGCDYGALSNTFFSVRYPLWDIGNLTGSPCFLQHKNAGLLSQSAVFSMPVLPWPLIASTASLLIFLFLILKNRKKRFEGEIFLLYLIVYSITRFLTEFLRGDADRGEHFLNSPFSFSQLISLLIGLLAGLSYYVILMRTSKNRSE